MVARDPHRWCELIHQEVRGADGTATPLHWWVRQSGALRTHLALWECVRADPALLHRGGTTSTSAGSTWCHACGQLLITRDWYQLGAWNLTEDGCCRHCGTRCAGRFEGPPEG
jgi:hypothetical protein